MLKGKSKIELFDAATGVKVHEQRDSNLVTNALDMLVNCKDKAGLLRWWGENAGANYSLDKRTVSSPLNSMLPLYKKALGGVLLWDESIEEDPSIIVPPKGVYEVGHAGGPYGGADVYRGSYNENESGEIDGGWRHVWDFDTDKANGTIKCLSLTSWHGGNVGIHGCFDDDVYPRYNNCYFHNGSTYSIARLADVKLYCNIDTSGPILYIRKMEDGSLRIYQRDFNSLWYLKAPDPTKLSLLTENITYTDKVELFSASNRYATVYVYKGQIHDISLNNTTTLRHRIFSLDGEQISDTTLSLPFSYRNTTYYCPAVYCDGYYYCIPHNDVEMIKLDSQGKEISRIDFLGNYQDQLWSITVNDFNDEITILLHPYSSTSSLFIIYTLNDKDEIFPVSTSSHQCVSIGTDSSVPYDQFVKTDEPNSPFVFYSNTSSKSMVPLINTSYLATINNLQVPITKTAAQTMKITYEIYDE